MLTCPAALAATFADMSERGTQLEIADADNGLTLSGEVDAHTAPQLEAALTPLLGGGRTVELDLGGVSFMDSSGLRVVISATEASRSDGGDLVLVRPSDLVRRLLSVSGLTDHLSITPAGC